MGTITVFFASDHLYMIAHLLVLSIWYGAMFWVTFIGGTIMFKNMQRSEFGAIQAKLFPAYFKLGNACSVILIATYFKIYGWAESFSEMAEVLCLFLIFFINFIESVWIGPWTTSVMIKKLEVEKSKQESANLGHLAKEFGISHGINSLLNLIVFISATIYLILLARLCVY